MKDKSQRDANGRFLPGIGGGRPKGSKNRITEKMLLEFMEFDDKGGVTPFKLWRDLLSGKYDDQLDLMPSKDAWTIRMKASECMAKYVYDASYETDEAAAKLEMSIEQINALKSAFPSFAK